MSRISATPLKHGLVQKAKMETAVMPNLKLKKQQQSNISYTTMALSSEWQKSYMATFLIKAVISLEVLWNFLSYFIVILG